MASSSSLSNDGLELVCVEHPQSCRGSCDAVTLECICRPEDNGFFVHDKLLFRYNNCAVPYFLINLICGVVMSLCVIALFIVVKWYRMKKGPAGRIIMAAVVSSVGLFLACLSSIIYQEVNPAFWFFMAVCITGIGMGFTTYLYTFFVLVYKTSRQQLPEKSLNRVFVLSVTLVSMPAYFIAFPASIVFMQTDPATYNNLIAIFFLAIPVQLFVTVPLLFFVSARLLASIRKNLQTQKAINLGKSVTRVNVGGSSPSVKKISLEPNTAQAESEARRQKKMEGVLYRLWIFRVSMIFIVVPSETGFCIMVALLHFLLQFQYLYILLALLLMTLCSCIFIYIYVSGQEDTGVARTESKNDSKLESKLESKNSFFAGSTIGTVEPKRSVKIVGLRLTEQPIQSTGEATSMAEVLPVTPKLSLVEKAS